MYKKEIFKSFTQIHTKYILNKPQRKKKQVKQKKNHEKIIFL